MCAPIDSPLPRLKQTAEMVFTLALAAALIGWQLFWPPIIGLADQGDFQKLLGPLGYAPVPKGPEHKYSFVTTTFVKDLTYREPRFEQLTSELIIARAVVKLNDLLRRNPGTFDIRLFGLAHALLFLLALARLLYVTRTLAKYRIIWGLMLVVLTDVGYVAYWNSLYTEPASCIWFLFFLAESISLCQSREMSASAILLWSIFAVLWITAKTQNAPLCLPLAIYGISIAWQARLLTSRVVGGFGIAAMCLAGVTMYRSVLPAPKVISLYDVIFYGILPESSDPRSDLRALDLNTDYAQYSGTLPWSPRTGVADGALVSALLTKVTPLKLFEFYLRRPARLLLHIKPLLPNYLSLRPEFCGNFEPPTGRPPGAKSGAIALWSHFHERVLSRMSSVILAVLPLVVVGGVTSLVRSRSPNKAESWIKLGTCLTACCSMAFIVAAFGDAYDNTKHQFLFNLLLDTCIVFGVATIIQVSSSRFRGSVAVAGVQTEP
jgi:hypothetical protein